MPAREMEATSSPPLFSVVIPAHNEAAHIGRCLDSVKRNTFQGFEIIVVDDGSTDETVDIARAKGVTVLDADPNRKRSISAVRNSGARHARGEIFAFLDADMIVPENWLEEARRHFARGFDGALGFVDRVPAGAGWVARAWSNTRAEKRDRPQEVDFIPSRNILVPRSVFDEVGGFDESLITCEDKDFCLKIRRAGHVVLRLPAEDVMHLGYERTLGDFIWKEYWRQGNTLRFTVRQGLSLRTLRNPAVSLWHVAMMCATLFSFLFVANVRAAGAFLVLWVLPSAVVAWPRLRLSEMCGFPALFFLMFLRWNVAGVALVHQLFSRGGHPQETKKRK